MHELDGGHASHLAKAAETRLRSAVATVVFQALKPVAPRRVP
jgi:hypothetical protein